MIECTRNAKGEGSAEFVGFFPSLECLSSIHEIADI